MKPIQVKIIQHAAEMFSKKGFGATSVRDIAFEADVNVAAVNYHFKSKEALLFKVIEHGHHQLNQAIDDIDIREMKSLEELTLSFFSVLLQHQDILINMTRIMFSEDCVKIEHYGLNERVCIPPGSQKILDFIQKNLNLKLKPAYSQWAVDTIIGQCFHYAKFSASPFAKNHSDKRLFNVKKLEENLTLSAQAIEEKLKLLDQRQSH